MWRSRKSSWKRFRDGKLPRFGGQAGRGARQPARAKGPGGGAAAAALGDEPAVQAGSGAARLQAGRGDGRRLPAIRKG